MAITVTPDEDFDSWKRSDSGAAKKATYTAQSCKRLNISRDAFIIEQVEVGSAVVYGTVRPPSRKLVMSYFSVDDAELKDLSPNDKITTIILDRFGLNIRNQVLFPQWN